MSKQPLLNVHDLTVEFRARGSVVQAVNHISFHLSEGETLGIVGESGSGKSVSMLSLTRLIPSPPAKIIAGEVVFGGEDLLKMNATQLDAVRGQEIAMIFQDPMSSLNPVRMIGQQIGEMLRVHLHMSKQEARERSIELLDMVGIPSPAKRIDNYPHEFSGGMRQRVMIAMAISCNPRLLIADEPTTALDVTIQAQIMRLIKRLQVELGMAVIWITHDLGVAAALADRIAVMYGGRIVEQASTQTIFHSPQHPYTLGLLRSIPKPGHRSDHQRLFSIPGSPPKLDRLPAGCAFYDRCDHRIEKCQDQRPELQAAPFAQAGQQFACWVNVQQLEDEKVKS